MKRTLKSLGIKRVVIQKHGIGIWVYQYKGKFYYFKQPTMELALEEEKNEGNNRKDNDR